MFKSICMFAFGVLFTLNANAKGCDPEKSKPCGQVCIKKTFKCHKSWTTQKMGEPGSSKDKTYDNPTYVETPPTDKKAE